MSVKYFFVGLSFFTLFSSTIYILTNDMTLVQIKPPRRDEIVKTLMTGRNSLNTIDHDPNCTTFESLQCHTNIEILKHNLVIDETIEEWSIIEKRNPVSKNCSVSNLAHSVTSSFETFSVIDLN